MAMFSSNKHRKSYGSDSDDDYYGDRRRSRSYSRSSPDSYGRNSSYDNHYTGKGNYYNGSSGYRKKNKEYKTVVLRMQFHCEACVNKVKNALNKIKGVESFVLDARRETVTVTGYIDPHKVHKKVSDTGKAVELEIISSSNSSGSDHRYNDYHRDNEYWNRNRNHYDGYGNNRDENYSYYHYEDEYPQQGYNRRGNNYADYSYQEDNSGCSIM